MAASRCSAAAADPGLSTDCRLKTCWERKAGGWAWPWPPLETSAGVVVGCAMGLQTACLEVSIKFANERILYGKPISRLPAIQNKLAEIKIDLEAGRLLGYRAAAMQDQGLRSSNEFAVAKYFTTEATQKAAKMAADIHGGYGCMEEYAVTRYLRDSFVLGPSAGTSDIMKVIVGRWVLS